MQSVAISCNQLQSEAISGTPVLVASKKASGACNQLQSVAISCNQWQSAALPYSSRRRKRAAHGVTPPQSADGARVTPAESIV